MNKERLKKLNVYVLGFTVLLTFISIGLLFWLLIDHKLDYLYSFEALTDIIATTIAYIYLIEGFKKEDSKKFKASVIATTVNALIVTIVSIAEKIDVVPIVMCAIAFYILGYLSVIKNIGKKTSYILCGILVLIRLLGLISGLLTLRNVPNGSSMIILMFSQLSLAILMSVLEYAKYFDKLSRGTN